MSKRIQKQMKKCFIN